MAYAHRQGDMRACGATTIVSGQTFVNVDGKLWSVDGDKNTHGDGALTTSHSWLTIAGKGVIVSDDEAESDSLCPIVGGAHCAPSAVGYSVLIEV